MLQNLLKPGYLPLSPSTQNNPPSPPSAVWWPPSPSLLHQGPGGWTRDKGVIFPTKDWSICYNPSMVYNLIHTCKSTINKPKFSWVCWFLRLNSIKSLFVLLLDNSGSTFLLASMKLLLSKVSCVIRLRIVVQLRLPKDDTYRQDNDIW